MPASVASLSATPWHSKHHQKPPLSNTKESSTITKKVKHKLTTTREESLLQVAQNEGFLHALTENELLENSQNVHNKKPSYPGNASLLTLGCRRLQNISLLDLCERLEICILSNNFVSNIEPLKWCHNLCCLDVHSNQLSHIPGKKFWGALPNLALVYMHNNGFSHLEEIKFISHSPSLCTLTLYDSPVSLKKNYRHCVVNAVWTLKALDNYVISDEEIIEDAHFTEVFKPLKKQFRYQSHFCSGKKNNKEIHTYSEAKWLIKEEIRNVNAIQSKYSPVLILQKCIRGYLVRLKYNYIKDTRLWAAVSIQRFYRDRKGYPNPPPTTPTPQNLDHMYQSLSSFRLDYETYLQFRRSRHLSVKSLSYRLPPVESAEDRMYNLNIYSSTKPILHRHINVNLEKLNNQTTDILNRASKRSGSIHRYGGGADDIVKVTIPNKTTVMVENQYSMIPPATAHFKGDTATSATTVTCETPTNLQEVADGLGLGSMLQQNKYPKSASSPITLGRYYTQYAFLGKIKTAEKCAKEDNPDSSEFRLCIRKPDLITRDPLEELIIRTVEGAEDIRTATREIDFKMKNPSLPTPGGKTKHSSGSAKKKQPRSFTRTHPNMKFSAFRAVEKAYHDRDQAEQLARKTFLVKQINKQERMGRNKVERFKQNYTNDACIKKHSERVHVLEELETRCKHLQDIHDTAASTRETLTNSQDRARQNYKFALDFRCQNASVGKALLSHDHSTKWREAQEERANKVSELCSVNHQKRSLARGYKEQTALIRQAEALANREELNLALLKNKAKRECDLRQDLKRHQEKQMRRLKLPTAHSVFTVN